MVRKEGRWKRGGGPAVQVAACRAAEACSMCLEWSLLVWGIGQKTQERKRPGGGHLAFWLIVTSSFSLCGQNYGCFNPGPGRGRFVDSAKLMSFVSYQQQARLEALSPFCCFFFLFFSPFPAACDRQASGANERLHGSLRRRCRHCTRGCYS